MSFLFQRKYNGPVKALIADMAGTVVDYGSCAPAGAFVELLRRNKITLTLSQAREPMGLEKKDHVRVLTQMPSVAEQWREVHGTDCTEEDVERMYQEFIPLQLEILPSFSTLIPGVVETMEELKKRGVRVGATTGYNREMMETVLAEAVKQGFTPESAVCASDVAGGRPAPWMIFQSLEELGVFPPEAAVKVGDTLPDVDAGLNAGVWTIGLTRTGNMLGMNEEDVAALPEADLRSQLSAAEQQYRRAGAHFVVERFSDCLPVIEEIQRKLARGERP